MFDIFRSKIFSFSATKNTKLHIDTSNCCVFKKGILNQASANRPMRAVVQVAQAQ